MRDADDFEMPEPAPHFDPLELQDDSFVNFSVGNLDRRNFSMLGVAKYVRSSSRTANDISSEDDSVGRGFRISGSRWWKKRRTRGDMFSPVKKCFV